MQVNIAIMRAFVRLRALFLSNADLVRKLAVLERKYDAQFKALFDAIRQLMAPPPTPARAEIEFHVKEQVVPNRLKPRPDRKAPSAAAVSALDPSVLILQPSC